MNKKGQFFIVFAIVFIFLIAMLTFQYNSAWSTVNLENFEELSENYEHEQTVVINNAIYEGEAPGEALGEFGEQYSAYSGEVDPNFGFVSTYYDEAADKLYIYNFLPDETIALTPNSGFDLSSEEIALTILAPFQDNTQGTISLDVGGQVIEQTVETELINFDEGYAQAVIDGPPENYFLVVGVDGGESSTIPIGLNAGGYLTTEEGQTVDVSLI